MFGFDLLRSAHLSNGSFEKLTMQEALLIIWHYLTWLLKLLRLLRTIMYNGRLDWQWAQRARIPSCQYDTIEGLQPIPVNSRTISKANRRTKKAWTVQQSAKKQNIWRGWKWFRQCSANLSRSINALGQQAFPRSHDLVDFGGLGRRAVKSWPFAMIPSRFDNASARSYKQHTRSQEMTHCYTACNEKHISLAQRSPQFGINTIEFNVQGEHNISIHFHYVLHASASSIEWVVKSTADAPALRKQREFTALQNDQQLTT